MTEAQARQKAVSQFQQWLGWSESNGKHKKIIDIYNSQSILPSGYKVKYTDAWCATAVSAVGVSLGWTDIILPECSCNRMIALYKKAGRWKENDSYVPQIGDLILYDWNDNGVGDNMGVADHIGMVASISGKQFTVIEGNKADAVGYREMTVNGKDIRGYCLPDYAKKAAKVEEKSVSVSCKVVQQGSVGDHVKAMQILLNGTIGAKLVVDGEYGDKTKAAIQKYQKSAGLTADGIAGKDTWTSLLT